MASRRNTTTEGETQQKIIDAALVLFAEYGIDGVPVRALTSHAGLNVAAIHYHFGGMEAVAEAVFNELSARINKTRISRLEEILVRAKAKRRKPNVAEVVQAFIEPYVDDSAATEGQLLAQLIVKHRLSPSPMTEQVIKKHFDPMAKQFVAALHEAVPTVPLSQMYWRYMLLVSTVVLTVSARRSSNRLERLSEGNADGADLNAMRDALVEFVVGGIRAPHRATSKP